MKKQFLWIVVAVFFGLGAGILAACSTDFDSSEEGVFTCESDDDCVSGYECSSGFCSRFGSGDNEEGDDTGPIEPESCDPEAEVYPYSPPLEEVIEVCDGVDNNCDGDTDKIHCEYGCPTGEKDPAGNLVIYRCNDESGLCEAFTAFDALPECAGPLSCTGGVLEVREDCY